MTGHMLCIPILNPQPTLLQTLAMEQGRLAQWTFGRPTDAVFTAVCIPESTKVYDRNQR